MKKLITFILILATALLMVSCGTGTSSKNTMGLGVIAVPELADIEGEEIGALQFSTTIVAATFDEDGKITTCAIDVIEQGAGLDENKEIEFKFVKNGVANLDLRSANIQGDDYGMKAASPIGKELNEQHEALANWMVGKTVKEIVAMQTISADEDLKASVTINVSQYLIALQDAWDRKTPIKSTPEKLGLGVLNTADVHEPTTDDILTIFEIHSSFVAIGFDADDIITCAAIDITQQPGAINSELIFINDWSGKVLETETLDGRSKIQKGPDYGMIRFSPIGKEVDEQLNSFANWMVGKTIEEVVSVPVSDNRGIGYAAIPTGDDLTASVTITIADYIVGAQLASDSVK